MSEVPFMDALRSMSVKTVLWDFDGVIANTEPVQAEAYRVILRRLGHEVPADFFQPLMGLTEPEIWTHLTDEYGLAASPSDLRDERLGVLVDLSSGLQPNWFVRVLLAASDKVEHLIISAGNDEVVRRLLTQWHLLNSFSQILAFREDADAPTKEERFAEVLVPQPDPALFLVVEDNARYLQLAHALGARTLGVRHELNDLSVDDADFLVDSNPSEVVQRD